MTWGMSEEEDEEEGEEDEEGVLSVANERAGAMRRQIQATATKSLGEDDERVLLRTTVGSSDIPLSD